MLRLASILLLACACATAQGSGSAADTHAAPAASNPDVSAQGLGAATARLEPRSGSTLTGTARFTSAAGGLGAHIEVQGAAPGEHGLHVHEKGNCDDPKAVSAGGHFNPAMSPHHGGPATPVRHGGDLGNIQVDASGNGTLDVVVPGLSVDGAQDGVVGRALVVHEKVDDLQTDPAGNSGGRIACGVIQAAGR